MSIEPKGFLNKNGKRPDVACSSWPWTGGTTGTRAIDVVTIATVGSIAGAGSLYPGYAAAHAEASKQGDWDNVAAAENLTVTPFAYELGGRLGTQALKFINEVANIAEPTWERALLFRDYWTRRISVVAQRGYGQFLLSRMPQDSSLGCFGPCRGPDPLSHLLEFPSRPTLLRRGEVRDAA